MSKLDAKVDSAEYSHGHACDMGTRWLKKMGFSVICQEIVTYNDEQPDVIAFKDHYSVLIEAKVSRADFLSDAKKIFRRVPKKGMGDFRFYICPNGIISPEDLPDGWGLIYFEQNKIWVVKGPRSNVFTAYLHEKEFKKFEKNTNAEIQLLTSALRRANKKEKNRNYKVYTLEEDCDEDFKQYPQISFT